MAPTAYPTATVAGDRPDEKPLDRRRRQRTITLGLLAAVVVVDQATKWWAWRHVPGAMVNTGSTWLIGDPVDGWVTAPVSGRLLDLLGLALLILSGSILLRRRRQPLFLVAGALMISGWGSNLLDRLGMHILTAPGSSRGAVDFLPVGSVHVNLADVVIAVATLLYLVARPSPAATAATERDGARPLTSATSPRP
jgi:lipoprotein signal peptidase